MKISEDLQVRLTMDFLATKLLQHFQAILTRAVQDVMSSSSRFPEVRSLLVQEAQRRLT
jgi:hypothetical protein